jgi:hypothetical protein
VPVAWHSLTQIIEAPNPLPDYSAATGYPHLSNYDGEKLGYKLGVPYVVRAPFLYTDDDIVVRRDPTYLLGDTPWVSGHRMFYLVDEVELAAYARAFSVAPVSMEHWRSLRTDGGVWYAPRLDVRRWNDTLRRSWCETQQLARTGHRYRQFDQRFLTMWNIAQGGGVLPFVGNYKLLIGRQLPRTVPTHTFVHYAVGGELKHRYREWLDEQASEMTNA